MAPYTIYEVSYPTDRLIGSRIGWTDSPRSQIPALTYTPSGIPMQENSTISIPAVTMWRTHSCVPRRYIPGTYYTQDTGDIVNKDGAVCLPQCPGKNTV